VFPNPWGNLCDEINLLLLFVDFLFLLVVLDAHVLDWLLRDPVDMEAMDHSNDIDPFSVSIGPSFDDFIITDTEALVLGFVEHLVVFYSNWYDVEQGVLEMTDFAPAGIFISKAVVDHVVTDLMDLTGFLVLEDHVNEDVAVG